jgi:hypothetical protein
MTHCLVIHHITDNLVFALVSAEWVMMCPAIDNPVSCKIRAVIRFLHAENMSVAKIHREICVVYGQNMEHERSVTRCCRMFKDGRANKRSRSGEASAVCSKCWPKIMKDNFTISEVPCCSLRDYHSWARLSQVLSKMHSECSRLRTKRREWLRLS